jgi:hypothetical protein
MVYPRCNDSTGKPPIPQSLYSIPALPSDAGELTAEIILSAKPIRIGCTAKKLSMGPLAIGMTYVLILVNCYALNFLRA